MDDKDKEILEYNNKFMKKILKSALYTFFICILTMFGINLIFDLIFQGSDTSFIISFCIGIIFTVFYCTFTIIEEIRKEK
ncbi:hypothetical protein ACF3M2_14075 [Tissierella carlieri]|uniref:hypothetical protein n=1 Tax=Tissierella carlieri TaxID=689904 RepID=UPI00386E3C0C